MKPDIPLATKSGHFYLLTTGVLRSHPHARSIVEPQPPARLLLLRNLQPFATPDALHPVLANLPAVSLQQRRNAAITIASILAGGHPQDAGGGSFFFSSRHL